MISRRFVSLLLAPAFVIGGYSPISAAEPLDPRAAEFFETEVRPLLAEKCQGCHGPDEANGGLRLDSMADLLAGGESGPAIEPGQTDASLLLQAVRYEGYEMPPDEQLPPEQIAVLEKWIAMGAPWPGYDPNQPIRERELFSEEDRKWWAIQPIEAVEHDRGSDKSGDAEIDSHIDAALADAGIEPAPPLDEQSLVRRVYLDTIGLPPTPQQISDYFADSSPDRYARLIDRLLSDRRFGEHQALWWLDLVRYADSDGYRADEFRPHAYHYRDYVVESFNADKPYDRFVCEQLAADEMFPGDTNAERGLGFLRGWVYEWNIRDARTQWQTILDDVTDTTADTFLALGLKCAKCHNHKFDPLLQEDYLRLQAVFAPMMPVEVPAVDADTWNDYQKKQQSYEERNAAKLAEIYAIEQPVREKYRKEAIDRFPPDLSTIGYKDPADLSPAERPLAYLIGRQVVDEYERLDSYIKGEAKDRLIALRRELAAVETPPPRPAELMSVRDSGCEAPTVALPKRPDQAVLPGPPRLIVDDPFLPEPLAESTGRRTALARWIVDPANPLTARVIVNRIWQAYFGRGIAANASDFGILGGPPSHGGLLDALAADLVRNDWRLKSIHRQILLSDVYRRGADHPDIAAAERIDPDNRLYWRRPPRRMHAELIRDSLLAVSSRLAQRVGGEPQLADSAAASIYLRRMRNTADPLLQSLDQPAFFNSVAARNTTTTAVQSLLMINSDIMLQHAQQLAAAIQADARDPAERVQQLWRRVYGRDATEAEQAEAERFVQSQRALATEDLKLAAKPQLPTGKLPYRDGQALRVDGPEIPYRLQTESGLDEQQEFTIEVFFQVRSIAKSGDVRTLVGQWNGDPKQIGWRFGISGEGSRRKPQSLVFQAIGPAGDSPVAESAVFSDHHIQLNHPYYAAAIFRLPRNGSPGEVEFLLKDLANDDEPLQQVTVVHPWSQTPVAQTPLTIGATAGNRVQGFDGLVDDIRLTARAIEPHECLHANDGQLDATVGFWRFEPSPGMLVDSSEHSRDIGHGDAVSSLGAQDAAWVDLCHALLQSNEFLYIP